jgi:hypothetical protein
MLPAHLLLLLDLLPQKLAHQLSPAAVCGTRPAASWLALTGMEGVQQAYGPTAVAAVTACLSLWPSTLLGKKGKRLQMLCLALRLPTILSFTKLLKDLVLLFGRSHPKPSLVQTSDAVPNSMVLAFGLTAIIQCCSMSICMCQLTASLDRMTC